MNRTVFAFAVVVVVAVAGWARAGDAQDLEARVKALEDRLAAAEKAGAASADGAVRVRSLIVQDEAGRDRIVIAAPKNGDVGVSISDSGGNQRLALGVRGDGGWPHIGLIGADGKFAVSLASEQRGTTFRMDSGSQQHLILDAPVDGAVGLGIWGGPGDLNEQSHAGYWVWKDGTIAWGGGPRSAGRTGFILKYDRAGKTEFAVRDPAEGVVWEMPTAKTPPR